MIGSVGRSLVAPENQAALLHPATRIVSLTVMEKACCLDPATGTLDEAHPDILHDMRRPPKRPRSAPGTLVAGAGPAVARPVRGAPGRAGK